ncbi:MAG: radical SAM protein [bacterium]
MKETLIGLVTTFFRWMRRLWQRVAPAKANPTLNEVTLSVNINKNLKGRFCANPFRQFDLDTVGGVGVCCSSWLPTLIGNLYDDDIQEIWNSKRAQLIRESIFDGSFRYCNHKVCPSIQNGTLPTLEQAAQESSTIKNIIDQRKLVLDAPYFINLCNDFSCNLSCPSCRPQQINLTRGYQFKRTNKLQKKLEKQLFSLPGEQPMVVNVTGSGDPFASKVYREFLYTVQGKNFPNLTFNLQTNGVLFTPRNWQRIHKIHHQIGTVLISFDAATEPTYNITRRGGNWQQLLKNVAFLVERRKEGAINFLRLDFVVQQANFKEMGDFIILAKRLGADQVRFSMILDWGIMGKKAYADACVWRKDHPQFSDFIQCLKTDVFDDPIVDLGNLTEYRQMALLSKS